MSHSDPDVRRLMRAQKKIKGAKTEIQRLNMARVSTGEHIRQLEEMYRIIGREINISIEFLQGSKLK